MERWPASVFQRSLVQLDGLMPGVMTHPTETTSVTVRVRGPLDVDVLDRAYAELVDRHELLRTRLVADGDEVWQEVLPTGEARLERLVAGDERPVAGGPSWPIPVDEPPLVRGGVVRVDDAEHLVGLTLHHAVADQSSAALAMRDLAAVYTARRRGEGPPPVPLQHGAYAVWQRKRLAERADHDHRGWATALDGLVPPTYRRALPFEPGRPPSGRQLSRPLLDAEELAALAAWAERSQGTTFAALLAAYARTLASTTDARDLPVMSAFEQRDHPAIRNLPGPFLYATLLRIGVVDGEPSPALVTRVRDVVAAAYSRAQVTVQDLATLAPTLVPGVLGVEPSWFRVFLYLPCEAITSAFRFGDAVGRVAANEGRNTQSLAYGAHLGVHHDPQGGLVARLAYDGTDFDQPAADALLATFAAEVRRLLG